MNVPPTPPSSPTKPNSIAKSQTDYNYAFAHFCDTDHRWLVSPHHFIINNTKNTIIGQFVSTDWFSCYIYPQKTFLVVQVKKGVSSKKLERSLNSKKATDQSIIKNIESFIAPKIKQNAKKKYSSLCIDLPGLISKNYLSFVLKETHHYQTTHSFYCTLPSFCFKN